MGIIFIILYLIEKVNVLMKKKHFLILIQILILILSDYIMKDILYAKKEEMILIMIVKNVQKMKIIFIFIILYSMKQEDVLKNVKSLLIPIQIIELILIDYAIKNVLLAILKVITLIIIVENVPRMKIIIIFSILYIMKQENFLVKFKDL